MLSRLGRSAVLDEVSRGEGDKSQNQFSPGAESAWTVRRHFDLASATAITGTRFGCPKSTFESERPVGSRGR